MRQILLLSISLGLQACVQLPPIYLVDRPTVMELEASGEWPQLEQRLREQSLSMGPQTLPADPEQKRRERAFRMLNGEYTSVAGGSAE